MSRLVYVIENHDAAGRVLSKWTVPAECVSMELDSDGRPHYEIERIAFAECDGSSRCSVPIHIHGCFADLAGANCDDPEEHDV